MLGDRLGVEVFDDRIEVVKASSKPQTFVKTVKAELCVPDYAEVYVSTCALRFSIEPSGIDRIKEAVKWLQANADICDRVILELRFESDVTPLMRLAELDEDDEFGGIGFEIFDDGEKLTLDKKRDGAYSYFKIWQDGSIAPVLVLDEGNVQGEKISLFDILKEVGSGVITFAELLRKVA
jgi:hypothetical protein